MEVIAVAVDDVVGLYSSLDLGWGGLWRVGGGCRRVRVGRGSVGWRRRDRVRRVGGTCQTATRRFALPGT